MELRDFLVSGMPCFKLACNCRLFPTSKMPRYNFVENLIKIVDFIQLQYFHGVRDAMFQIWEKLDQNCEGYMQVRIFLVLGLSCFKFEEVLSRSVEYMQIWRFLEYWDILLLWIFHPIRGIFTIVLNLHIILMTPEFPQFSTLTSIAEFDLDKDLCTFPPNFGNIKYPQKIHICTVWHKFPHFFYMFFAIKCY